MDLESEQQTDMDASKYELESTYHISKPEPRLEVKHDPFNETS